MYENYWKLTEKPFRNTPDPRYLYPSAMHEEAMLKLTYGIAEGMGCAMLSGVFGCGKTLLGQAILNDLTPERYRVAFVNQPHLTAPELLRAVVRHLKVTELPQKMNELMTDALLETLQEILVANLNDGLETVVLVDEAHVIDDDKVFDCLRMLLNFQLQDKFLLTLLIFGQPELRDRVKNLKQFDQRIAIRCHLDRFQQEDTLKYVAHRLKVAGRESSPFSPEALNKIHELSGGIPRRINNLCDLALLTGMGRKLETIEADVITQTGKEFL